MVGLSEKFVELKRLFQEGDSGGMKGFAAQAAREALEYSEAELAQFSVVSYALEKLMDKPYIVQSKRWKKFAAFVLQKLDQGEKCREDVKICESSLSALMHEMDELSSDLGKFVMTAVEKAKVKAATQIYAHGASIGRAVELTGADRKELLNYIGNTRLPEKYETKSVGHRLAFAEKLFRG